MKPSRTDSASMGRGPGRFSPHFDGIFFLGFFLECHLSTKIDNLNGPGQKAICKAVLGNNLNFFSRKRPQLISKSNVGPHG
jgi:hypothetical protein